jgi:hypothetical protein
MAFLNIKTTYQITIPTPFYKKPFEFTVGFRNTFFLFIIAYYLVAMAIKADNPNLGVFALIFIFLVILSYYFNLEDEFYVWSYNTTPAKFLIDKIKTTLLYSSFLYLPVFLLLSILYFEYIGLMILVIIAGYLALVALILAKYSAYPDTMGLKQALLLFLCLFIPPMIVVAIPYFAYLSVNRLKGYLV